MTSKQRVLMALEHKQADRVPLDIGGISNSTMHAKVEKALKERLGMTDETVIQARRKGVAFPTRSIVDYFGSDTCSIYLNETHPWIDNGDGTFTDMWHIGYKLNPDGLYYNRVVSPLADAEEPEDLDDFECPVPNEEMLKGLPERLDEYSDKCCILDGLKEPFFGLPSWLRGTENFYVDLLANEELCDALLSKILAAYKVMLDYIMERIGDRIDVVKLSDDLGTQESLLLSPETFRARIKPFAADLYAYIKNKYKKKLLLHSCGAIRPLINDFIEMGVDAINPVQISAKGMIPAELKAEFGDRIAFWGGGVDTQKVLPRGTVDDVRKQVKENLEIFKKDGGYIFTQVHNIEPDVPVDNILAMYETFHQYCNY